MLSPTKKTRQTRRHICTCQAHNCFAARFTDANGTSRPGIELSPEAFEAHQRTELRLQAQAALSVEPDDLASRLERVALGSNLRVVPSGSGQTNSSNDRPFTTSATRRSRPSHETADISNDRNTTDEHVDTVEGQLAAESVQVSGIQAYSCGAYPDQF
ncbi:uncharacterized protein MELLADRAFT_84819 [Melampsora larici-populina 98AG31]|uniref:Uncharacterized protein n=1 Tax=Melampsora larici-populina (strain 98AG31 / pathotype 3-4-7) TaxID=747676 RepID=F4SCK3_MELLP|nr:uncharacterized protein MELLADRAFT_84819 [Melampsora larici-populina 98AG31]EGF97626.1 hypothetical protein MELLADRAFT_84819 [Melampsora larici-populina 98AG31]